MTCWRRLHDWKEAGVWQQLHELLLAELRAGDALDLSRASVDGSHLRALKGGDATGPSVESRRPDDGRARLRAPAGSVPALTGRPRRSGGGL